jgi:hypothetical protein
MAFHLDGDSSDRAWWLRAEWAWPLAILLGFGGTWAGLAVGAPWLSIAIAAGLVVPLVSAQAGRGRPETAAWSAIGWLAGIAGAAAGAVLDSDAPPWSSSVVGEAHYRALAERWLAAEPDAGSVPWAFVHAVAFAAALGLSRWSRGASAAAASAVGAVALSTVSANLALPALRSGRSPLTVAAFAVPPHLALEIVALAIGGAALASPAAVDPGIARRRRYLLGLSAAAEAAALASGVWAGDEWGRWASARLAAP